MDDLTPIDTGIAAADGPEKTREYADVEKWRKRIAAARKHDEEARKRYAKDRRYARGDSGFAFNNNIVGTNIDILETFLYAKDPDVDVLPAKTVQPPNPDVLAEAAEEAFNQSPDAQQLIQMQAQAQAPQAAVLAGAGALVQGQNPIVAYQQSLAEAPGELHDQLRQQYIDEQIASMQKRYAKLKRDADTYAETLEIVISRLWRDANLKDRGRRLVRSGLTIGVGILKASWQERTAPAPETTAAINDLQDNIKRATAQRAALEESDPGIFERMKQGVLSVVGQDVESKLAEYQRQLAALKAKPEPVIARGYVVDKVAGEDFQIPPGWEIASHLDAPWNAHRIPMLKSEAQAHFGLTKEQIKQATIYTARRPEQIRAESASQTMNVEATDAEAYVIGARDGEDEWVMAWEIWDRDTGSVLTMIEGVRCWVKPAWQPKATTRFYPFFLYTTSEVDGERHPQSLVSRSAKLVDENNRIGSAEAEHRRRIIPMLMFNEGMLSPESVKKLNYGVPAEKVGVKPTKPDVDLKTLFAPVIYPPMDPALYDRSRILAELERIWGIQEALSGTIQTAKTATEAEIQQSGFTARTGGRRDLLESMLNDLAQYTAEIAHANLSAEDVRGIAGPDAIWPEYKGPEDLASMVNVEIRAGSSGKPNTTADRQAWASQLPLLQSAIIQIGQLRSSSPLDVADGLEKLLRITAERSGDRINIDQLVPKPGQPPMLGAGDIPEGPPANGAPDDPAIAA